MTYLNREQQMNAVQSEALELFSKKNKDYGDAFADYGPIGVIVRMGDKIRRLQSITKSGVNFVKDESIRDTLIDLHNYAAMAVMLIDEEYNDESLTISTSPIQSSDLNVTSLDTVNTSSYSPPPTTTSTPSPPPPPPLLYRQLTEIVDPDIQVLDSVDL